MMTRLVWFAIALSAMWLGGCGGAMPSAPPSSGAPYNRAPAEASPSPSMASGSPAPSQPAPRDRDADGIPSDAPGSSSVPPPPPSTPPSSGSEADGAPQAVAGHDSTMLVYTATLNLAVYLVDQAVGQVEQIAKDNGGFLASRGDNQITIRVPRARFQPALASIEKTGDVLHRDVRAEDVTDQFMDLDVRIKNARAMRDQLALLLTKANVKEAIEIERELGRVTEELERMEGQMKLLKDKIAYSTITVSYAARGSSIEATKVRLPFPWLVRLGLPSLLHLEENK